jgi:hypothetical protein
LLKLLKQTKEYREFSEFAVDSGGNVRYISPKKKGKENSGEEGSE